MSDVSQQLREMACLNECDDTPCRAYRAAAARIEELEREREDCCKAEAHNANRANTAEARIAALEEALRDAPHGPDCVTLEGAAERAGRPCDCWKSTAYTANSRQSESAPE